MHKLDSNMAWGGLPDTLAEQRLNRRLACGCDSYLKQGVLFIALTATLYSRLSHLVFHTLSTLGSQGRKHFGRRSTCSPNESEGHQGRGVLVHFPAVAPSFSFQHVKFYCIKT